MCVLQEQPLQHHDQIQGKQYNTITFHILYTESLVQFIADIAATFSPFCDTTLSYISMSLCTVDKEREFLSKVSISMCATCELKFQYSVVTVIEILGKSWSLKMWGFLGLEIFLGG